MFNVRTYLSKLKYTGSVVPTVETVRELQKKHLMLVPFDSAPYVGQGMTVLNNADIDTDTTFDRMILDGRGGSCFDLNGIFRRLLEELGFDVFILAAGMPGPDGSFGLDIEHMFNGVRFDGGVWLVDVGFPGPSYIEPIRLTDEVQEQYGCQFQIVEQGGYHVVQRKGKVGDWSAVYRFKLRPRSLDEWKNIADLSAEDGWNWEGEEVAAGTIIRGRTFDNGQMILLGRRYTKIDGGYLEIRTLADTAEYERVLKHVLLQDA